MTKFPSVTYVWDELRRQFVLPNHGYTYQESGQAFPMSDHAVSRSNPGPVTATYVHWPWTGPGMDDEPTQDFTPPEPGSKTKGKCKRCKNERLVVLAYPTLVCRLCGQEQ